MILKISNFGSASQLKKIFGKFGTLAYMAPEVNSWEESKTYDNKADIWSLGCIFYKLITNRNFYEDCLKVSSNNKSCNYLYSYFEDFGKEIKNNTFRILLTSCLEFFVDIRCNTEKILKLLGEYIS